METELIQKSSDLEGKVSDLETDLEHFKDTNQVRYFLSVQVNWIPP